MSKPSMFGGPTLLILVVLLGVFGLFIPLLLLAFFVVLGYYLYMLERRLTSLEGAGLARMPQAPKKPDKPDK